MQYSDQKKGMLLAFTAIAFITPDSLFIRLANLESWNLIFYRGFIPFIVVFVGLLIIYKNKLITELINNGWHGIAYAVTFTITNILFVISIENTSVANTLIMISLAPMLSAIISLIFLSRSYDLDENVLPSFDNQEASLPVSSVSRSQYCNMSSLNVVKSLHSPFKNFNLFPHASRE